MPDIPEAAIEEAAEAIRSAANMNDDGPERFEARVLAKAALEAAAPLLAETIAADLRVALGSITLRITSAAMDYGTYEPNAWVYGIAVGWDCEEDHGHDDICGGTGAMEELAARFGWDEAAVARLRGYRRAYAAATREVPGA